MARKKPLDKPSSRASKNFSERLGEDGKNGGVRDIFTVTRDPVTNKIIEYGESHHYLNRHWVMKDYKEYQDILTSGTPRTDIEDLKISLGKLYEDLVKQENAFYGTIRCSGLIDLYNRLEPWRAIGQRMLSSKTAQEICVALNKVTESKLDTQVVLEAASIALDDKIKSLEESAKSKINEMIKTTIDKLPTKTSKVLNLAFESTINDSKVKKFGAQANQGVNTLEIIFENGRYVVKQIGDNSITNDALRHMAQLLNQSNPEIYQFDTSKPRPPEEMVADVALSVLQVGDKADIIRTYMNMKQPPVEGKKEKSMFAFQVKEISIQGWLAEIYWNAMMADIFNDVTQGFKPTGSLLNQKSQQLPFDMVLETALQNTSVGIGFQIKNWSIKNQDGSYQNAEKTYRAGTFLATNGLIDLGVGTILARMFGHLGYNRPNDEFAMNKDYGTYVGEYNKMKSYVTGVEALDQLSNVLQQHIVNISHIAREDIAREQAQLAGSYRNTFWLINDKIVPSSLVVKQMIRKLESNTDETPYIRLRVTSLQDNNYGSHWPYIPKGTENFDKVAMANHSTIKYVLTFDVNRLAQDALAAAVASGESAPAK